MSKYVCGICGLEWTGDEESDCPTCNPSEPSTHCLYNVGWGKRCGKPATHDVVIEGYEDRPQAACEYHAAISEHHGFTVRARMTSNSVLDQHTTEAKNANEME